jgi:hypothetical protein
MHARLPPNKPPPARRWRRRLLLGTSHWRGGDGCWRSLSALEPARCLGYSDNDQRRKSAVPVCVGIGRLGQAGGNLRRGLNIGRDHGGRRALARRGWDPIDGPCRLIFHNFAGDLYLEDGAF